MKLQWLCLALYLAQVAVATDVRFSLLVAQGAVIPFNIALEYRNDTQREFIPYVSCEGNDDCVPLNWDDDAELRVKITPPTRAEISRVAVTEIGNQQLENPAVPVKFKIQACYETPFIKNRKWRKAKDIIQDDKRCAKKVVGKRNLPEDGSEVSYTYAIKSDSPGARFFLTLFVFCKVEGKDDDQYCAIDTTGDLSGLAKAGDIRKRLFLNSDEEVDYSQYSTSEPSAFRTTTIDSRPTKLIVSVIVLSILSVSMLVLYFVYERVLKKTA